MTSWKIEATGVPRGAWTSNGVRFADHEDAEIYRLDLRARWTGAGDTRVVESDDPPNYHWVDGHLRPLPK